MTADLMVQDRSSAEFEQLRRAAAVALPHPGGQLWRLWPVDRGVELRAESVRRLPASGAGAAAIRISAGAALLNMRLSVAVLGERPVATLLPDPTRPRVLTILRRGMPAHPTPAECELSGAMERAVRPRPRIRCQPVPAGVQNLVRRAAEAERVWLRSVTHPEVRKRLLDVVPALPAHGCDGLLMVIGSNHDVPAAHLQAGQGIQRAMLTAAALGFLARVVAWPPDLRVAARLPNGFGGFGLAPLAVLEVGRPGPAED